MHRTIKHWIILSTFLLSAAGSLRGETPSWKLQRLVPEGAKEHVRISSEFRYRLEARNNFDFDSAMDDEDIFHLFRTRLNLETCPVPFAKLFAQFQDARIASSHFADDAPFEDPFDLRQGYLEFDDRTYQGFGLQIGRQELVYGAERLIGAFNWSNVSQSFDAVRLYYQWEKSRIDVFGARKVVIDPSTIFNDWNSDDNLAGIYASCQALRHHTFDIYTFFRDTDSPVAFGPGPGTGELSEYTTGVRAEAQLPNGLDYQFESAVQFGKFGGDDIRTWMLIVAAGYTFDIPWKPRLALEFDHASGDDDPNDGERNTFDNLFPTNHLYYGFMDLAGLQNLNDFVVSAGCKPAAGWVLKVDLHFLFLDETSDSLYNAARVPVRTAPSSGAGDEIGQELDATVNYQFLSQAGAMAGYSHFFAGDFLSDTGAADGGDFFYLQLTINF